MGGSLLHACGLHKDPAGADSQLADSNSGVLTNVALFMRTARSMVKQEGLQSMFVGMGPRLACAIPQCHGVLAGCGGLQTPPWSP